MSDSEGTGKKGGGKALMWVGILGVLLCGGVGVTGVGGLFAWRYYAGAEQAAESAGQLSVVNEGAEPVFLACTGSGGEPVDTTVPGGGTITVDVPARPARCTASLTKGDPSTEVGAWLAQDPPSADETWTFTIAGKPAAPAEVRLTVTSQASAELTLECTYPGMGVVRTMTPGATEVIEKVLLPVDCKGKAADGNVVWSWNQADAPSDPAAGLTVVIPADALAAAPATEAPPEAPPAGEATPTASTPPATTPTASTTPPATATKPATTSSSTSTASTSTSTTKPSSTTTGSQARPTSTTSTGSQARPTSTTTTTASSTATTPSSSTTATASTTPSGTQTAPSTDAGTSGAMFLLKIDVKHSSMLKGAAWTVDGKAISAPGQKALSVGSHTLKIYKKDAPAVNVSCTIKSSGKDLSIVIDGDDPKCP